MHTFALFILLALLGIGLLLVLRALIQRLARRAPKSKQASVTRSVVYLVSGSHLLVMQQARRSRLRARLEVPKGKIKEGETAVAAAYRECREESGLRPHDLQLLTVFSTRQRTAKRRSMETWAAFWGTVPVGTALPFTHRVSGTGGDRSRVYHYRLVPLATARLHPPLDVPLPALQRVLSEGHDNATTPGVG